MDYTGGVIAPAIDNDPVSLNGYCGTSDWLRIPCMTSSNTNPNTCFTDLICGNVFNTGARDDGAASPTDNIAIYSKSKKRYSLLIL